MKRIVLAAALALLAALPARAEEAIVTYKSIAPDVAFDLARAALNKCRKDGYQVAVVVLDRFGAAAGGAARPLRRLGRARHCRGQGLDGGDLHPRYRRVKASRTARSVRAWRVCRK